MKDYYKILELEKTCSLDQIKKQYKILAMKNHPDKGGDSDKFKDISEAYQTLSDSTKRYNYDNYGNSNILLNSSAINPMDLFAHIFANQNLNNIDRMTRTSTINLNSLFSNMDFNSNINFNSNIGFGETHEIYIINNKKIEKIKKLVNGIKQEIIIETNLTTGEKKQKIRQIN